MDLFKTHLKGLISCKTHVPFGPGRSTAWCGLTGVMFVLPAVVVVYCHFLNGQESDESALSGDLSNMPLKTCLRALFWVLQVRFMRSETV